MKQIKQIAGSENRIYALCEDGTLWEYNHSGEWSEHIPIPELPEPATFPKTSKLDKMEMPNPTVADMSSFLFNAIWNVIKSWDVNAPKYYDGYCGANGSHVKLIMDSIDKTL